MSLLAKVTGVLAQLLLTIAMFALPSAAMAAGYTIIAPLKGKTRPDLPPGTPFYLWTTPSISGDYVVFTSRNGPPDGVWSYHIPTKKLRKLAGLDTKVPGGKGKFKTISDPGNDFLTTVGGSTVVFFGRDQDNVLGIYAVPVEGGEIARIVSTNMNVPGTTEKFNDLRTAATNGTTVVFWGNRPSNVSGIYQAPISGTSRKKVIDGKQPLDARTLNGPSVDYYGLYTRPTIGKTYIQFSAGGLFDPVTGPNALFRANNGFNDIADNMTKLEGGTAKQHVRISGSSAAVGSSAMAFIADEPNTGYIGLFKIKNLNNAEVFVSTKTDVPGKPRKFAQFYGFGYDTSGLAFTATYKTTTGVNQSVWFVAAPGDKPVHIASSDDYYLPIVGDRSVSNGRIVFSEATNYAETFYLATPKP